MLHKTAKRPQDTKKELYDRDLCHQIMKIYFNTENKNEEKMTESQKLGTHF